MTSETMTVFVKIVIVTCTAGILYSYLTRKSTNSVLFR